MHIIYRKNPRCPKCGCDLDALSIKPHWFPYIHVDFALYCPVCGETYTFGIPQSRDAGLSLHVFDSNPVEVVKEFERVETPECPWGHGKMIPTKVFGDWIEPVEEVELQWKCKVCFLTIHKTVKRSVSHGEVEALTEEEQKILEERLRSLGYID